jgi:hypothetical protein
VVGNRRAIAIFIVLALSGALALVLINFSVAPKDASAMLDNSVRVLLDERLRVKYTVRGAELTSGERDASGIWHVSVFEPDDLVRRLLDLGFASALDDDEVDLRRVAGEANLPTPPTETLEFYRAEIALGKGSICERAPCNISVGIGGGGDAVFMISRI